MSNAMLRRSQALQWQDVPAVACIALEKYFIKLQLQTPQLVLQILQHERSVNLHIS